MRVLFVSGVLAIALGQVLEQGSDSWIEVGTQVFITWDAIGDVCRCCLVGSLVSLRNIESSSRPRCACLCIRVSMQLTVAGCAPLIWCPAQFVRRSCAVLADRGREHGLADSVGRWGWGNRRARRSLRRCWW